MLDSKSFVYLFSAFMISLAIIFILGFSLGYLYRAQKTEPRTKPTKHKSVEISSYHQRLKIKSMHQQDSDRIRELNKLSTNQSIFFRLLQHTFSQNEVAVKNNRFIVLDRDFYPIAIFEYRDGTQAMKVVDQEDGLPLYLYKGLISQDELKHDLLSFNSSNK
jgi:hypothetical protein